MDPGVRPFAVLGVLTFVPAALAAFVAGPPPVVALGGALLVLVAGGVGLVPPNAVAAALPALIACRIGLTTPFAFAVALPPIVGLWGALVPFVVFGVAVAPAVDCAVALPPFAALGEAFLPPPAAGAALLFGVVLGLALPFPLLPLPLELEFAASVVAGAELVPLVGGPAPAEGAAAGAAGSGGLDGVVGVSGALVLASSQSANGWASVCGAAAGPDTRCEDPIENVALISDAILGTENPRSRDDAGTCLQPAGQRSARRKPLEFNVLRVHPTIQGAAASALARQVLPRQRSAGDAATKLRPWRNGRLAPIVDGQVEAIIRSQRVMGRRTGSTAA